MVPRTIIPAVSIVINTASGRTRREKNRRRAWWAPARDCCDYRTDCWRRSPARSAAAGAVEPHSIAACSRRSAPPIPPAGSHTFSSPAIGPAVERINWNSQRSTMDSTRARCCHWHDTDESYVSLFLLFFFQFFSFSSPSPSSLPVDDTWLVVRCGIAPGCTYPCRVACMRRLVRGCGLARGCELVAERSQSCVLVRIAPLTSRAYGNFNQGGRGRGLGECYSCASSANSR